MLMTEAEEIRMIKDVAMHGANYPGNMIPVINKLLTFSYFLYTQLHSPIRIDAFCYQSLKFKIVPHLSGEQEKCNSFTADQICHSLSLSSSLHLNTIL